jgi:Leucine-rich repeat (LRR) protein
MNFSITDNTNDKMFNVSYGLNNLPRLTHLKIQYNDENKLDVIFLILDFIQKLDKISN